MQIANISIADGKPTPVVHLFSPTNTSNNLPTWHNRQAGVSIGFETLMASLKSSDTMNKFMLTLKLPTLEVISGSDAGYTPAPQVAYTTVAKVEILCPARNTLQDRKDLRTLLVNVLNNPQIVASIENLEQTY